MIWVVKDPNRFPTKIPEGTGISGLEKRKRKEKTEGEREMFLLTLKETMKPPFVHSSTIGFKIFGT